MNLSITNSAVYGVRTDGKLQYLPELGIAQCAQAGFDRMEFNFQTGPAQKPLAEDNWQEFVARIGQTAADNHIAIPYVHSAWYIYANAKGTEDIDRKNALIRRSVEAAHMLGSRLMVFHALSIYDENGYNGERSRAYNRTLFSEIGELAAKYGIGLAVENVFPIAGKLEITSYAEDTVALIQDLNDPLFGICWDIGHANMAKLEHETALQTVAPWLRLVHAADNKAVTDEHTVPGYGTVPWDKVMAKLKAIGYKGDLNLAVRTFAQTTTPDRRIDALKYLRGVGTELIRMYDSV